MRKTLLALPLLYAAAAYGSTPHDAWTLAAVRSLPTYHEDVGQPGKPAELELIATHVARASRGAPRPPREWASAILTVWRHESNLSSRIIAGNCKAHECDRGRARGGGQVHRNALNAADWDAAPGNIAIQVKLTDEALRRAYWTCARSGAPWLIGSLNAYAGRRCGDNWVGLMERVATFAQLQRVAVPKGGAS